MISLITTDAGDTLGIFTKPSGKEAFFDRSGIPAVEGKAWIVDEEERRFLHTTRELTSEDGENLVAFKLSEVEDGRECSPTPRGVA